MADTKRLQKIDEQMAALKEQRNAEKKRIRQQEKKEDDRRKFLTGAIVIDHAKINVTFKAKLEELLKESVPEGDKYLWPELFETDSDDDDQDGIQAFHNAYTAIGQGQEFVRIHKIREKLGWTHERFNSVLEQLTASYKTELHGGDPSQLTAEELEDSYRDKDGQQFITLSWRK